MMRSHFEDLRRRKEYLEKRDLSIRTISQETGLSHGAILRVKNLSLERVYFSMLEKLCEYFSVQSLAELIEYVPGEPSAPLNESEASALATARSPGRKHKRV